MAHGLKYVGYFKDKDDQGYRVSLLKKGYSSTVKEVTLIRNPIIYRSISLGRSNPIVFGSEMEVQWVLPEADRDLFNEIFTSDYKDWQLRIFKINAKIDAGTLFWAGYVQPENLSRNIVEKDIIVSLSATDALKDLRNIEYTDASRETISIMTVIKKALTPLGLNLDFFIKLNTYETTNASTALTLGNVDVDNFRFANSEDGRQVNDSCLGVLEQVLTPFNVTLRQVNGKYRITNNQEEATFDYTVDWATLSQLDRQAASAAIDCNDKKLLVTPDVSMIKPAFIEITQRNRNLGTSLVANLNQWTDGDWSMNYPNESVADAKLTIEFDQDWEGDIVGDPPVTLTLDTPFAVSKNSDNDYLRVVLGHLKDNVTGDGNAVDFIATVKLKKPSGDWTDIGEFIVTSGYFETGVNEATRITESGNYELRIEFTFITDLPALPAAWAGDIILREIDITKVVMVGDDEVLEDVTFDRFIRYKTTKDVKDKEEITCVFGDSLQLGDIGAFYTGGSNTSNWTGTGLSNSPILKILGQQLLTNRSLYKKFVSIGFVDTDILPDSLVTFNSETFRIVSYEREIQRNEVRLRLEQLLTVKPSFIEEEFKLTSIDGVSKTSGSTVVPPMQNFTSGRVLFGGTTGINTDGDFHWDNINKRLGIKTTSPTRTLDVDGLVRFRTGAVNGYFLSCDANGNASWVAGTGGGGGDVDSFSAGTTGFTPSTATTGHIVLSGILKAVNGGTGLSAYTANNYIRAANATTLEQRTPAQVRSDIGAAAVAQTMHIGTTAVAINRASGTLNLAGIGTFSCGAITSVGLTNNSTTFATRMATTATAANCIPVFTSSPASTTRTLVTRTPAQLLDDLFTGKNITAGRVLFGAGAGAVGSSANLFWHNTNSRLSIGAGSSPSYSLQVSKDETSQLYLYNPSNATGKVAGIRMGTASSWEVMLRTNQSTNWFEFTNTSGLVVHSIHDTKFYPGASSSNGTATGYISGDGTNIGIGTTSPVFLTHLQQDGTPYLCIERTTAGQTGALILGANNAYTTITSRNTAGGTTARELRVLMGTTTRFVFKTTGNLEVAGDVIAYA